ncbi:MAG TPA: TetR/AcrR family transcriptional regulator [Candidatus Anoxymicrobiaceae bacterium]
MEKKPKSGAKVQAIIDAALKVFGEKGYYDATISDVARRAKVSEATIYEYFGSKEDLLFAIPREITQTSVNFLHAVLPFISGSKNKIRAILYGYYNLYKENPEYSALVLLNLKHNRKFMETEGYAVVRQAGGVLLGAIDEGIRNGEFRSGIDPRLVRSILLGTLEHIFFRWHLLERKEELPDFVDQMMDILMNGAEKDGIGRSLQININLGEGGTTMVETGKPQAIVTSPSTPASKPEEAPPGKRSAG